MKQYVVGMRIIQKYGEVIDGVYCPGELFDKIWRGKKEASSTVERTLVFSDISDAEKYAKMLQRKNNKFFDELSKELEENRNEFRVYIKKTTASNLNIQFIREVSTPYFESIKYDYPSAKMYAIRKN